MAEFKKVAKTSDILPGQIILVELEGERILLSNLESGFYAIGEVCTHAEGPLSEGTVQGQEVECPWHASFFNLKTGEVTGSPAVEPLPKYPVKVEGDDILISLG